MATLKDVIYVDPLMSHGWSMYGRPIKNCHMFSASIDLTELHAFAKRIGLKRSWFQGQASVPHYDLTPSRRLKAVAAGAIEVDRRAAVALWRQRRIALRQATENIDGPYPSGKFQTGYAT